MPAAVQLPRLFHICHKEVSMPFSIFSRLLGMLFVLLVLGGCQSALMVAPTTEAEPKATADKALVVFMRPSSLGGAVQSSVYDTRAEGNDVFAGVVSSKSKVAYLAEPGQHLFMVVSENADFLAANLEAGKRYYVLVAPRMGVWRARFSLLPIRNDASAKEGLQSKQFRNWDESTEWMVIGPKASNWYQDNIDSIRARKLDYLPKWQSKSAADKAERTLRSVDGI
ncbi:hypothetical protein [Pseudomonas sp. OHS18]|uniref:hypothetical protein n=2 Tax=Pseudomonas TaxID=286 RepID=UPI003A8739C4